MEKLIKVPLTTANLEQYEFLQKAVNDNYLFSIKQEISEEGYITFYFEKIENNGCNQP